MKSSAHIPRIVIAGTHSGCGKTTTAIGLMSALSRKNYKVQGFKAGSMARSAAAMVHGYKTFDPNVRVVGVIANNIANENHFNYVKPAIEEYTIRRFVVGVLTNTSFGVFAEGPGN